MFQKSFVIVAVLFGLSAFATDKAATNAPKMEMKSSTVHTVSKDGKTHTFKVDGMHCGGCVANVQRAVCKDSPYEKCAAKILNEKKEIGELSITLKDGQTFDEAKLRSDMKEAGYPIK